MSHSSVFTFCAAIGIISCQLHVTLTASTTDPIEDVHTDDYFYNNQTDTVLVPEENPAMATYRIIMAGMSLQDYKVSVWMGKLPRVIIYAIGLVGNFLSGLVMFQKKNMTISCYFYMGILAMLDSVPILVSWAHWVMDHTMGIVPSPKSHVMYCQAIFAVLGGCILSGTYVILAMTFDRYVAVNWPLKALTWCSVKRAKITTLIIFVSCCLWRLPYIFWTDTIPPFSCAAFQGDQSLLERTYYWANSTVTCYLPFTTLLVLNLLIVKRLNNRQKYFDDDSTKSSGTSMETKFTNDSVSGQAGSDDTTVSGVNSKKGGATSQAASQRSLTLMLLLVSFTFLMFQSPLYIFYIVYMFKDYLSSAEAFATFNLAIAIVYNVYQINHGINFYLYCLGGSKFRRDLRRSVRRLFRCRK